MHSLTAKHHVIDMPDGFRGAVVHPPSWFASVEPSIDGSSTFAFASADYCVASRCETLHGLVAILERLQDFDPGVDTAVHRSYHQYDFWISTISADRTAQRRVRLSLNDCADVGREPAVLGEMLDWLADRVGAAGAPRGVVARLSLWARPPRWGGQAEPGSVLSRGSS
jgi:hypothetical protein